MNHIYKTIFNKRTGQISVVSEKSSNHSQSQQSRGVTKKVTLENKFDNFSNLITKRALTIAISLILSSTGSFADIIYKGDSELTISQNIGGNFDQVINNSNSLGIIDLDASNTTIIINYLSGISPEFVVAGYNYLKSSEDEKTSNSLNNNIKIENGNIDGNIYSGLSHISNKYDGSNLNSFENSAFDKIIISKKNSININNNIKVMGDIYSGYSVISMNNREDIEDIEEKLSGSFMLSQMNNNVISNENIINLNGKNNILKNITSGYSASIIKLTDLFVDNENFELNVLYRFGNEAIADNNSIYINGNSNSMLDINSGNSNIIDDLNSINQIKLSSNFNNANSVLSSSLNSISINGDNNVFRNITSGQSNIYHNKPIFSQSLFYEHTINSDENSIYINGNKNIINNITSGKITVTTNIDQYDLQYEGLRDIEISSIKNSINILGESEIQGDIYTGNIGFYIRNIDSIPVEVNLEGTTAFSTGNHISIQGTHTFPNENSTKIYGGNLTYNNQKYIEKDIEYIIEHKPKAYDVFTSNTLNYSNTKPITIKEIGNFQNYNFTLNPNLANENIALIKANTIYLGSSPENMSADQLQKQIYNTVSMVALAADDLSTEIKGVLPTIADDAINPNYKISDNTKQALLASNQMSQQVKNLLNDDAQIASNIKVVGIQSGPIIAAGTKFVLMQADKSNLKGEGQGYTNNVEQVQQGISLIYDVQTVVDHTNDQVYALFKTGVDPVDPVDPLKPPKLNPQLKALLEGNLSGLMLLTQGTDHLSDNIFGDEQHKRGLVPFAIFSGQHSRYNTGSHIKSNS